MAQVNEIASTIGKVIGFLGSIPAPVWVVVAIIVAATAIYFLMTGRR
jgi:hypothetical protein